MGLLPLVRQRGLLVAPPLYPACGDAPGSGEGRAEPDDQDETPQLATAGGETPQLEARAFRLTAVAFPDLGYIVPEAPVPGAPEELGSYLSPETLAPEVVYPSAPRFPGTP